MTDSIDEKLTPRHDKLNPQAENFDFELVEVRVTPDQENLSPSPLEGFVSDDDTIDTMFVDTNANQQHNPEPNTASHGFAANNPNTLITPAHVIPEIKTNFYVDYFDNRKPPKTPDLEPVPETDYSNTIDDRSQDAMTVKNTTEIPTEPYSEDDEQLLDNAPPVVNGSGMAVAVLSQFKSKQESINKQQEKLIQDFSKKIKTATRVTYTAVFFGVVALVAASTLGVMLLKTKSEVSDLAGTTTALKDNIRNIKATTPSDLEGTDPAIDQLNQKVDDVIEQLNEVSALQTKTLNAEKTASTKPAPTILPAPVEKTTVVTKPLPTPLPSAPIEKTVVVTKPATIKPAPITEKKPSDEVTKTTPVNKVTKKPTAEQAAPVVKVTTAKTTNKANSTEPKKVNDIPDKAAQVPSNDINKLVNTASPNITSIQAVNSATPQQPNKTQVQAPKAQTSSGGGWTVNLGSSNKLEDAKNTAARFAQKGVPVIISSVTVKNETRYRLQVKGFKNKEEATAYGNKAKDALKLNSVWINQ